MRRRCTSFFLGLQLTLSILVIIGIQKVDASLKDQLVFIEGTAPPSSIVSAIQDTGRDAILRGSGTTNSMRSPYTLVPVDTLYLCLLID